MKQTESSSLIGGWSIFKDTMRDLKSGWRVYLLIILIVTVPIRLFGLSKSLAVDGSFGALSALASFILNLALLSLATRRYKGESPTVASIYYEGTSSFVRYLVTSFLLTFTLIPFGIGFWLFYVGNLTSPSFSESLLLGLVGLVIAIPSLWLLIRFALAPIIIASEDVRPWRSLQRSRELTLGRFWQVMGRYAVLIAWLFLIGVIVTLLITALGLVWHNAVALDFIYQFVLSLVGLPIGSVYLVRLYQALKSNQV